MPCNVVMFSHPARAAQREATLAAFAVSDPGHEIIVWRGRPPGEGCNIDQRDIADFVDLIAWLPSGDLLFLEDDILPCRNALAYMKRWSVSTMTSFYNPNSQHRKAGSLCRGFIFSQAFKMPAQLVARMQSETFPAPLARLQRDGIDQVVNRYLRRWDVPYLQHRSVVEHVGDVSTWTTSDLSGPGRRSADFPGPDVDALTFAW